MSEIFLSSRAYAVPWGLNLCFFCVHKINSIKCINVDSDHFKNNQIQWHAGHITHFDKITLRKNNCDWAWALLTTLTTIFGGGGEERGGGVGMNEDAHAHARWSSTNAWWRSWVANFAVSSLNVVSRQAEINISLLLLHRQGPTPIF